MKTLEQFKEALNQSNRRMAEVEIRIDKVFLGNLLHRIDGKSQIKLLFERDYLNKYTVINYVFRDENCEMYSTEKWITFEKYEKWNEDNPEMDDKVLYEAMMDYIEEEGF